MNPNIWLFDGERGNTTRFTLGADHASFPVWSPDGSRIAYVSRRSNENLVIERPASGTGKETVLYRSTGLYYPESWSGDGRWLVLMTPTSGAFGSSCCSFYLLPMGAEGSGGERSTVPFPGSPTDGRHPSLSRYSRWLLYSSTQTGSREVFVESMPEAMGGPTVGVNKQVSIAGGGQPAWRADGKEIFYVAADGKMMSVSVDLDGGSLKLHLPKPLFQTRLVFDSVPRQYDVSADGKRFLLPQPLEESTSVPITVIVNWPELLKKGAGDL
jgi:Tol biopolymer transport system component